jgi:hypothetical protein
MVCCKVSAGEGAYGGFYASIHPDSLKGKLVDFKKALSTIPPLPNSKAVPYRYVVLACCFVGGGV